jgi:hypothetical protein
MPVRKVVADNRVKDDAGKIAVQRGPIIFCAEWADNNPSNVRNLVLNEDASFETSFNPDLLGGTQVVRTAGSIAGKTLDGKIELTGEEPLTLIPYALWNNRGPGQMMVWLPTNTKSARPVPAPTISYLSKVKASKVTRGLSAVNDQEEPSNSNDHTVPYYHWWPDKNTWEYVQYDFDRPRTISKTKVYWFDDGPGGGCRIPDEWEILTLNDNVWEPVKNKNPYKVTKDGWDSLTFNPVRTRSVKIKVRLNKDFASGIYEWIVE